MRELGKYILMMVAFVLMIATVVLGESNRPNDPKNNEIKNVKYNFTGDKARVVFELSQKSSYRILEDWADNRIVFEIDGTLNNADAINKQSWKSYIIKDHNVKVVNDVTVISIITTGEFKINYNSLDGGKRLYLDIFRNLDSIPVMTLLKRGDIYESRAEYSKAVNQFDKALIKQNSDNRIKYSLAKNLYNDNQAEAAEDVFGSIDKNSSYYALSLPYLNTIQTKIGNETAASETSGDGDFVSEITKDAEVEPKNNNSIDAATSQKLDASDNSSEDLDVVENSTNETVDDSEIKKQLSNLSVGALISNTGAEDFILYGLYVFAAALIVMIFALGRKVVSLYSKPKRVNKSKKSNIKKADLIKGRLITPKKNSSINVKQAEEVQLFAEKLANLYKKTGIEKSPKKEVLKPARPVLKSFKNEVRNPKSNESAIPDHTSQIENVFNASEKLAFETEEVKLIKKFKGSTQNAATSGEKSEAIRSLHKSGWEVWEIARELGMGSEDVKIALSLGASENKFEEMDGKYDKIVQMYNLNLSVEDIAERLGMGREEVLLALKLNKKATI